MIFVRKNGVLAKVNRDSKNGKEFAFLKIADPKSYDTVELMASRDLNIDSLAEGSAYDALVDIDGRYSTVNLVPAAK